MSGPNQNFCVLTALWPETFASSIMDHTYLQLVLQTLYMFMVIIKMAVFLSQEMVIFAHVKMYLQCY